MRNNSQIGYKKDKKFKKTNNNSAFYMKMLTRSFASSFVTTCPYGIWSVLVIEERAKFYF